MNELNKDTFLKERVSSESINNLQIGQTVLLKKRIKGKKTLDDLGEIEEAKKHCSANRPLHIIKDKLNNNVNFCRCCDLPCEEKGIAEPFNFCDNIDKFSECGLDVSLYFYFFKFLILVLFISICVIILSMMIFNKHYTKGINRVCNNIYKINGSNNLTYCEGFVTESDEDKNLYSRFITDWILTFTSDNLMIYQYLHEKFTNNGNHNAEDVLINYSLLNFFFLFTIFILNIYFIILINAKATKVQLNNITMRDYTVLISNSKHILIDYLSRKQRENPKYYNQSKILVENTEDFIEFVDNYIKSDKSLNELKINNISMCYNFGNYMELRDKLEECKLKIFKIKNDQRIIKKNMEKGYLFQKRYYYNMPLSFIGIYCINWKDKTLDDLESLKDDLDKKIKNEVLNFEILTEANFTGYMFVSFNYIKDKEIFLERYPNHFADKVIDLFKNIKFYLCCCCVGKGERIKFNKLKGIDVDDPPEPEDLYFENFKYSKGQRIFRIFIFFLLCLLIIAVSFAIILLFTYWQDKITESGKDINLFVKYLLSILITLIVTGINEVLSFVSTIFTKLERHLSRTNYYLSLSLKIAVFTFFNSAIVPLIAKEFVVKRKINNEYNIDRNNLLVNDMFVMFLVNAIVTPILWIVNIPFILKYLRKRSIEKKPDPDKNHFMTQRELNELYEYPDMKISYKYAYLAKTIAMTFFYLPIFPMGFFISFIGFILGYIFELYNFTHRSKRPEMLDETISKYYANYFVIILFIGAIGDLFFFYEIFPDNYMSIANFVIFLILIFVPYSRFTNCCFIGGKNKSFYFPDPLSKTYFTFFSDYERKNPFTQRKGYIRYLTKLKEKKYLSSNTFNIAIANLDKINLMEIYYGISRGNIPLMHQSAISNKNNNSILGKNLDINLRQSLANSNKKETNEEILEKQKFFDSLFMSIFGRRNDQYETDYPIDYPMDTIEEENNESDQDNKEKFINDYNNPAGINTGLGPLPMDDNVYESVPLSKSKQINLLSKDKLKKKNTNDSYDISIKIKNNINRNKKYEDNLRNKNELESMKNDFDSESKEIPNMPFNASIQRSQNDNDMNTNYKNSSYKSISIDKNMQNNSINNMPIDTSTNMMNNSDDHNNDNNHNSMEVKNNLNNLFNSNTNTNKKENEESYLVSDNNKSESKNNFIPMSVILDKIKKSQNKEKNQNNNNLNINDISYNNISEINHSISAKNVNLSYNEKDFPKIPKLDRDKIDMNISKSLDADLINEHQYNKNNYENDNENNNNTNDDYNNNDINDDYNNNDINDDDNNIDKNNNSNNENDSYIEEEENSVK